MKSLCKKAIAFLALGVMMFSFFGCNKEVKIAENERTYKSIGKFTKYEVKDTKGMKLFETDRYKIYFTKDSKLWKENENGKIYHDKMADCMFTMENAEKAPGFLKDLSEKQKSDLKERYKLNLGSGYEGLKLYYTLISEDVRKKDAIAREVYDKNKETVTEKEVLAFDNGKVKGFVCWWGNMYMVYFFSEDETKFFKSLIRADDDIVCTIVNTFEFK